MIDIKLKEELKIYIEKHYVKPDTDFYDASEADEEISCLQYDDEGLTVNERVKRDLQNFNDILRTYIRNYNKKNNTKDSDIYKKANIPKEHFNKIINQKIKPQKKPLIALGIALDLTKEEIENLLHSAGFHLTNTSKLDIIVLYCLEKDIRDIMMINEILYENGVECLGSTK